jgi:hypothetical protein
MMRTASKAAARAPLVADETKKWLQWDEFLGFVQALRAECAGGGMAQHAISSRPWVVLYPCPHQMRVAAMRAFGALCFFTQHT